MIGFLFDAESFWMPAFRYEKKCIDFAEQVVAMFNAIRGVSATVSCERIQCQWTPFAKVSIKGLGTLRGRLQMAGMAVHGLCLEDNSMMPIKPFTYVCETTDGDKYIWFDGGPGMCRTVSMRGLPQYARPGLVFAEPEAARYCEEHGGYLNYSKEPRLGYAPVFFDFHPHSIHEVCLKENERLYFNEPSDFRLGKPVVSIYSATTDRTDYI